MHRFLVGENAEWVDASLGELGDLLRPGGVENPSREGYIHLVMQMLESSNAAVRRWAVESIAGLLNCDHGAFTDETNVRCIDLLAARLQQDDDDRLLALQSLHGVAAVVVVPGVLLQHVRHAVVARLEDSDEEVVAWALQVLGVMVEQLSELEQANLSQHAGVVVAKLEDSASDVRTAAMQTLGKMEPATIAQHSDAVVAMLEDSAWEVRRAAVETLGKLDPVRFAQYADAVIDKLDDDSGIVRSAASNTLRSALPPAVTRGLNLDSGDTRRSQLRARLRWYRCRLHFRLRFFALRWYAHQFRPSGPGCARDVEAWGQLIGNADQSTTTAPNKRHKTGGD